MPLTKAEIDKVCKLVRKELKGSGMVGEGNCGCDDMKGEGPGSFLKKQAKKAKKAAVKTSKQVSRKTGAADKAKQVSRYVKDKDKMRNLAANVATTGAEGAVGLAAGTAATTAGANPITGAIAGAAATEAFKQAGGSKAIGDAIRGQGAKKKATSKTCSKWQEELAKYRKSNPGCSLKDAMKACKKKKQ